MNVCLLWSHFPPVSDFLWLLWREWCHKVINASVMYFLCARNQSKLTDLTRYQDSATRLFCLAPTWLRCKHNLFYETHVSSCPESLTLLRSSDAFQQFFFKFTSLKISALFSSASVLISCAPRRAHMCLLYFFKLY